jgi:uncharacterized protein YbaP (TraB family)
MARKLSALLLLSLSLIVSAGAARAQDNSLLWRITGKGLTRPSYLFGTVHMICPQDFFLAPAVQSSFAQAKTVYLEVNLDDASLPMKLIELIQLKDGRTLSSFFDSSDYTLLERFVHDTLQMDIHSVERYKPIMLYSMLSSKMLPCAKEQAYEMEFVQMAKDQKKPVKGLEKIEDQVAVFDSIPAREQADMIMDMVKNYNVQKADFSRLIEVYKTQQIDSLYKMVEESPDTRINQDLLLFSRNRKWIPVISVAIHQAPCFIAVGAGHLGGPQGLIALLRRQGYTVKPAL